MPRRDQVAEQVSTGFADPPFACRPKLVEPEAAIAPLYGSLVAVSELPDAVPTAFHMLLTVWPPGQVQLTFHDLVAVVVLVLVTVTVALKPPVQLVSTCMLAKQPPPDEALDVVALTAVDLADTLPAASYAATEYEYAVPAVSPASV